MIVTGKPAAIRVVGLGKTYRVWKRPSDMLLEALALKRLHTEFAALSEVSFEVLPGSVTGIMGRNGAGKSTLLRIVAGTLDATRGTVEVNGRVAAILELGTGFSPDYTGRDNIFLGGMCLGLKHREIKERLDEIVAFADIGEFIDRPFRTFSSGMQARLTFAVATCVDPDILIIDEALAVGDARFQVKSFDRVREFKRLGKSILLVSHDMNQIASICDRAILLERGRVIADGSPQKVCNIYHELLFAPAEEFLPVETSKVTEIEDAPMKADLQTSRVPAAAPVEATVTRTEGVAAYESSTDLPEVPATIEPASNSDEHRYGDGAAQIVSIKVTTPDGNATSRLKSLETYCLACRIRANSNVGPLVLGWLVRDKRGIDLFGWDMQTGNCDPIPSMAIGDEHEVTVCFRANLSAGNYFLTVALADIVGHKHDVRFEALEISVIGSTELFTTSVLHLEPRLTRSSRCRDPVSHDPADVTT